MTIKDLKYYRSYLPVRQERNETLFFINQLLNNQWLIHFWFDKYNKDYIVRYRFGDKNITQIYMKDKSWHNIPLPVWINIANHNIGPQESNWLKQEKIIFNIKDTIIKKIPHHTDILDL